MWKPDIREMNEENANRVQNLLKWLWTRKDKVFDKLVVWCSHICCWARRKLREDVVMCNRYTTKKRSLWGPDHIQPIGFLSWSPNGKYLAIPGISGK